MPDRGRLLRLKVTSFCLAGWLLGSMSLRSMSLRSMSLRSMSLRSMSLRSMSLRSTAISFCLKADRAGAACAPPLHPGYPANTTARCAGALSKTLFLTDRTRFAPSSTRPLAASLRLALENAFPSAFVMPLKVNTQVKTEKIKDEILNKTSNSE